MSKQLTVEKVWMRNFLTFADRQELSLAHRGIVGVQGENLDDASASSNGSGKSAIPDAVAWCWFGVTIRGIKGDEVVNRFVGHDCEVGTRLSDGNEKYVVTRYRKHKQYKDQLELATASGTRLTKGSIKETQAEVERILGLDFDTLAALLCGQGITQPFSAMTDARAQEAIEELAGTTLYADAAKAARKKAQELRAEVEALREKVEESSKAFEEAKADLRDIREKARTAQSEKKGRIEAAEDDVRELEQQADKLRVEIKKAKVAKRRVEELEEQEANEQGLWERANKRAIETARDVEEKRDYLEELVSHKAEVGQVCTRCGGVVDKSNLASLVSDEQAKLDVLELALPKFEKSRDAAADSLAAVRADLKAARALVQAAGRIENQLLDKQREIDRAKANLKHVAVDLHEYDELIDKAIERKERHYKRFQEARQKLGERQPLHDAYSFWVAGFGNKGIKSLVLDDALPFLNERAAAYSKIMTDGNLTVRFRTTVADKSGNEVERFGVDVVNRHGGETYQANSAGEKRKVDVVVTMAFLAQVARKAQSMLSCIFLDEVFDGLDAEGLDRALQIITEELGNYDSVFVISHRQDLADYFQHSITVRKKDNTSTIID